MGGWGGGGLDLPDPSPGSATDMTGVLVGNFSKITLKGTKIAFDRCGSNGQEFYPWEGTILRQQMSYSVSYIFSALYPKRYHYIIIILKVVILDFSTLCDTNLHILTPKWYDEQPHYFYIRVPLSLSVVLSYEAS